MPRPGPLPYFPQMLSAEKALGFWSSVPEPLRLRLMAAAGETFGRLYAAGYDLRAMDPLAGGWSLHESSILYQLASPPIGTHLPMHTHDLIVLWTQWRRRLASRLPEKEMAQFVVGFGQRIGVTRDLIRKMASEIPAWAREYAARDSAATLHDHLTAMESHKAGWWMGSSDKTLAAELEALTKQPSIQLLKTSASARVLAATFRGEEVVLKHFPPPRNFFRKLRSHFFCCKATRSLANALSLRDHGIHTPEAIGLACTPNGSWLVSRRMPNAITVRDWIKPRLHLRPEAERHAAADLLLAAILRLLDAGFWHADIKPSNILVPESGPKTVEDFAWIDLECIRTQPRLNYSQLLLNLAQLNGGIGRRLPREDRLRFLEKMALHFPVLQRRGTENIIEQMTRKRLLREVRRECGF